MAGAMRFLRSQRSAMVVTIFVAALISADFNRSISSHIHSGA
jgi:hypothetical protein